MSRYGDQFRTDRPDAIVPGLQRGLLDRLLGPLDSDNSHRLPDPEEHRESLRRDLSMLLNTHCHPDSDYLRRAYPLVAASVMNFGIPPVCGLSVASLTAARTKGVEQIIRRAVECFEPRIKTRGLTIKVIEPTPNDPARCCLIDLIIEGEAVALSEKLVLQATLNVATGCCEDVREKSHA